MTALEQNIINTIDNLSPEAKEEIRIRLGARRKVRRTKVIVTPEQARENMIRFVTNCGFKLKLP